LARKADTILAYIALFAVGIVVAAVLAVVSALVAIWKPIVVLAVVALGLYIAFQIYASIYFGSDKFKAIKGSIRDLTNNCNELNHHIEELKSAYVDIRSSDYGEGAIKDNSRYNYKRTAWTEEIRNRNVHNCSSLVCKNASNQPIKYLCKYFDIKPSEVTLADFESVLNDFSAAEQGKGLLQKEKESIVSRVSGSVPLLILFFFEKRLDKELGFEDIDLSDLYFPIYTFQYVSAGGNSAFRFDIKLNVENLDKLVIYLKDLVTFRKSVEGQRALMTSGLREKIKVRDNFACKMCGLSTSDEKNLLLEIDHIIPLSKGGITSELNLQTLCWRCNRTKGSRLLAA
jgi:hypothetical protein